MKIKTYDELMKLKTFDERFKYLSICGCIGVETFGSARFLNQQFYTSKVWRQLRHKIIVRDNGCDLGLEGFEIPGRIYIHHLNPISIDDLLNESEFLLNPQYLICCSDATHKALHYGDSNLLNQTLITRGPSDTCPWKT